jgi:ATP-binding cassette subfamily B (MDR/TAP) protein 1
MCICIYMCMCIHMYIYTRLYVHMYIYIYAHVYMCVYIHATIPDQPPLPHILLNRENIELGLPEADLALMSPEALNEAVTQAAEDAHVLEFTQSLPLGLDTPVGGGSGKTLSGGQVQRVALARALIREARVLILDEHTSSLDTKSETAIQFALGRTKANRITVLVAHRPAVVQQADVAFVLAGGRLMEVGSHAELVKRKGTYAGLFA